ncbi:MAG: hypothetical protein Q4F84_07040 [Fibrobacter sp.]|nr:hypothetical protein [Fibrobacter sp.]
MINSPLSNYPVIVFVISGLVIIVFAAVFLYKKLYVFHRGLILKKRFKIARKGETKAHDYLVSNGFRILDEQAVIKPGMTIDNEKHEFTIRADFIASKNGRKVLVEAKTGASVNPTNPLTRRQLLEYFIYYDVETIYLFDAENDLLREISFCLDRTPQKKRFVWGVVTGIVISAVLTVFIVKSLEMIN